MKCKSVVLVHFCDDHFLFFAVLSFAEMVLFNLHKLLMLSNVDFVSVLHVIIQIVSFQTTKNWNGKPEFVGY